MIFCRDFVLKEWEKGMGPRREGMEHIYVCFDGRGGRNDEDFSGKGRVLRHVFFSKKINEN